MPPTKKATKQNFIPNNVWATAAPTSTEHELTLPSGQTCRARKLGMEGLIQAGILSEADDLTSLVGAQHVRKVRGAKGKADGQELDTKSLMKDPKALGTMIDVADRAIPLIVVSPVVTCHKNENGELIPLEDRDPGMVYTDQIDMLDKFELLAFGMGDMESLKSFRGGEATGPVAAVGDGKSVPRTTKRTPRSR